MTEDFRHAGRDLHDLLAGLREQVHDINTIARGALQVVGDEWQETPAELLAPQSAPHRGRPTAEETLARMPRIVLDDKSSLFRQASLEMFLEGSSDSSRLQFPAIPAEFGPTEGIIELQTSTIIVAAPKTAKGGLSEETKTLIGEKSSASNKKPIVYMERGDGITFVQKAIQAQQAGAVAAIIGNNMSTPWPYVMKDSKGEAPQVGLTIPVVMIKQSDGKALLEYSSAHKEQVLASLKMQTLSNDCVVCCETFHLQETVMQIPACRHVFHEKCAMAWLTRHNTCPFCRRELPTDDADYEQERRRTQRTHAGSATTDSNESQWSGYYG